MADESEQQLTFTVKSSNDAKYAITITANSTVSQLKEKLSTSDFADIPTERQRLIYSGRVLKDNETLASYKIKDGNTIHLVKGAESNNRQNPANQGGSTTVPGAGNVPTNIAAGTGAHNPLAQLTGARYAGFHQLPGADMFGADGGVSTVLILLLKLQLTSDIDGRTPGPGCPSTNAREPQLRPTDE